MAITGLITEYNPFHNGHLHHLQTARRITAPEGIVVVMSGNYVQRGLPACVDKYRRTRMALEAGADIVIELPLTCATGGAAGFADGAVGCLSILNCVTDLVYGCEAGEDGRAGLRGLAGFLTDENVEYTSMLRENLRSGMNFPTARQKAVNELTGLSAELLSSPNNILAVEYEKALIKRNLNINTHAISRNDDGYHATGTELRRLLRENDTDALRSFLPEYSLKELDYHIEADDFSDLLNYRLITADRDSLAAYQEVGPELAARIMENRGSFKSFSGLAAAVVSRNTTLTSVNRALLHILFELERPACAQPFLRVLGFKRDSRILHTLKEHSSLPLITKVADIPEGTYDAELSASDIYRLAVYEKTGLTLPDEYHAGPVII